MSNTEDKLKQGIYEEFHKFLNGEDEFSPISVASHDDTFEASGFAHTKKGSTIVLGRDGSLYRLPKILASQWGIVMNDLVEGVARSSGRGEYGREIIAINSVNGVRTGDDYVRSPNFREMETSREDNKIILPFSVSNGKNKLSVLRGARNVVMVAHEYQRARGVMELARAVAGAGLFPIIISFDDLSPLRDLIGENNFEYYTAGPDASATKCVCSCVTAIFSANERARNGQPVIFIIDNLQKIVRLYNRMAGGEVYDPNKFHAEAMSDIRQLFHCAKVGTNGGSITPIIYALSGGARMNEAAVSEFEDLFQVIHHVS